ncbi:hypothetical protein D3C75_722570 [compost metagenome]
MPKSEHVDDPQPSGRILNTVAVELEQLLHFPHIHQRINAAGFNFLQHPACVGTLQPVTQRHRETKLGAVQDKVGNNAFHRFAEYVFGRAACNAVADMDAAGQLEQFLVQERNPQLQ